MVNLNLRHADLEAEAALLVRSLRHLRQSHQPLLSHNKVEFLNQVEILPDWRFTYSIQGSTTHCP